MDSPHVFYRTVSAQHVQQGLVKSRSVPEAALLARAGDEIVQQTGRNARHRHRRLADRPEDLSGNAPAEEQFLLRLHPARQPQRHQEREADDHHVALLLHVGAGQRLDAERADRAEQGDVAAADDRPWQRGHQRAELADHAHADQQDRADAYHPARSHARQADQADVLGIARAGHRTRQAAEDAAQPLGADAPADLLLRRIGQPGRVADVEVVADAFENDREEPRQDRAERHRAELRHAPGHEAGELEPLGRVHVVKTDINGMPRLEHAGPAQREADAPDDHHAQKDRKDVDVTPLHAQTEQENQRHHRQRRRPVPGGVAADRRARQRKTDGHDRRAHRDRADEAADPADQPELPQQHQAHAAGDQRPADVLQDHARALRRINADDRHDRRDEAEARTLHDRQPGTERAGLDQRAHPHGEIHAGNEKSDLRRRHPHRRAEDQRHQRRRSEQREHMLRPRQQQNRQRRDVVHSIHQFFSSHHTNTSG